MANLMRAATSSTGALPRPRRPARRLRHDRADLGLLAFHRLAAYLAWRTDGRIGMVMGVPSLLDQFEESTHADLPGGILESFGRLFKNDLRLFVYPMLRDGEIGTVHSLEVAEELQPLYDYLEGRAASCAWTTTSPTTSPILSRDVFGGSPPDDQAWEARCRPRWVSSSRSAVSSATSARPRAEPGCGGAVRRSAPPAGRRSTPPTVPVVPWR